MLNHKMNSFIKSYLRDVFIESFEERFNYLKLHGVDTFGFDIYESKFFIDLLSGDKFVHMLWLEITDVI